MKLEAIGYDAGGTAFEGILADGSGGESAKAVGVLVLHEGAGLTEHVKGVAARLAGLGHVAYAPDLFGSDVPLPEAGRPETMAPAQAVVKRLRAEPARLRAQLQAALGVLRGHPRVDGGRLAAIGYCFGGAAAIELARSGAELKAVAGFHAGLIPGTAEDDAAIRAQILLCHGAEDPVLPAADILAFTRHLTAADKDWQLHLYGGVGHSFTNPEIDAWGIPGFAFDSRADERAWAALMELFARAL